MKTAHFCARILHTRSRFIYTLTALFLAAIFSLTGSGCRKDNVEKSKEPGIVLFVFNQGAVSRISKDRREVIVEMPDYISRKELVAIFQLTDGATAKVNNTEQFSSTTANDFSGPVKYLVTGNGTTTEWTIKVESNSYRIGLGSVTEKENRLHRDFDWYIHDAGSHMLSSIAMLLRWCHPLYFFNLTTAQAVEGKLTSLPLNSNDVIDILKHREVPWVIIPAPNSTDYSAITSCIDKGYPVLLFSDFRSVPYNSFPNQHANRFWPILNSSTGIAHALVIKGYKQVDGTLFYETYDAKALNQIYSDNGESKGYNRYYAAENVKRGMHTGFGFPYFFVIGEKAKPFPVFMNQLNQTQIEYLKDTRNGLFAYVD